MARNLTSRIPAITAELGAKLEGVAAAGAELIERRAKERVPVASGKLRDAIHVEHTGPGEYTVVAGDTQAFYGHIIEHGGAHTPAHPFLVPAAEESREEIVALGIAAMKSL